MNQSADLQKLLHQVANGLIAPETAWQQLQSTSIGFESVGEFAKIDHHRQQRNGFPEVIWGADKTPEQIIQIMQAMLRQNRQTRQTIPIMATRITPEVADIVGASIKQLTYYPLAKIAAIAPLNLVPQHQGNITIITAGTSDIPVAEEAAITAELSGFQVSRLWDVGVAGIHRLLSNLHYLEAADVAIVVAGMEGALPSVVGGLAKCPIIAVPTSVGYGASFQGLSALLTMLNSCASGIGVMNIDNGFGAAILAGKILRTAERLKDG